MADIYATEQCSPVNLVNLRNAPTALTTLKRRTGNGEPQRRTETANRNYEPKGRGEKAEPKLRGTAGGFVFWFAVSILQSNSGRAEVVYERCPPEGRDRAVREAEHRRGIGDESGASPAVTAHER